MLISVNNLQSGIINLLLKKAHTRKELTKKLHTARTTIYDNLLILSKLKIVENFTVNNHCRGRPLTFWKIKD